MNDPRDALIANVVRGRTFVDVGGLWGLHGEKVSVAYQAGAFQNCMADARPFSDPLWDAFDARMKERGCEPRGWQKVSKPLDMLAADGSTWDVVHCSGVLYHLPDPIAGLRQLRAITRHACILGSMVAEDNSGSFAALIPRMPESVIGHFADWFRPIVGYEALGITKQDAGMWTPGNYDPWWWVFSAQHLQEMAESIGFRVHTLSYMLQRRVAVLEMEPA